MGWRGALPKAVSGAKLDVSVCPRFLCGRSSWWLQDGWAEAGVVKGAASLWGFEPGLASVFHSIPRL